MIALSFERSVRGGGPTPHPPLGLCAMRGTPLIGAASAQDCMLAKRAALGSQHRRPCAETWRELRSSKSSVHVQRAACPSWQRALNHLCSSRTDGSISAGSTRYSEHFHRRRGLHPRRRWRNFCVLRDPCAIRLQSAACLRTHMIQQTRMCTTAVKSRSFPGTRVCSNGREVSLVSARVGLA